MASLLLCATTTGYQTQAFREAAERLGHHVVLATDRCHVMSDPWADQAIPMRHAEIPSDLDGVVALGDKAALFASTLGLRFHASAAVEAATDKRRTRERFRAAGMRVPGQAGFPCVVKPVNRSASQGVIRANNRQERDAAVARVRKLVGDEPILIEDFIPGHEYAIEGLVSGGRLHVVAMFDKPDPLDGPFFEENVYVVCEPIAAAVEATEQAIAALGLSDGPIHAEMRIHDSQVWMLEVAPRPIGGLCARAVPGLPETIVRHALTGEAPSSPYLGPSALMMIPVGAGGIYRGVAGLEEARRYADVEITAKEGQHFRAWPEGSSYPGFIFAAEESELRQAHACLRFDYAFSFLS